METKHLIRGWRRTYSGDGVILSIPQGQVHLRPSITPLRPAEQIWREWIPTSARIEGPFALISAEGEYGVIVNAVGEHEQTTVAILYADQSYALLHARTTDPSTYDVFVEVVRRLAHGHSHGLGSERRRLYFYDPPAEWQGIPRTLSTLWLAPDCGQRHATIQVFHARPHRNTVGSLQYRQLYEQLPREFSEERPQEPAAIDNSYGLKGQLVTTSGTVNGARMMVSDAALTDGRMLYLLRLETAAEIHDEHLPRLVGTVASVRAVPPPKADVDVLIEWFAAT